MKFVSDDVTMFTDGTGFEATGKTLIISSHGGSTGTKFSPAYPVVPMFGTPKGGALSADLIKVIKGDVTASEIALGGKKEIPDYDLSHFEHDPSDVAIELALTANKKNKNDVLIINSGKAQTLSGVIAQLDQWNLKYPGILCIFCRVTFSSTDFSFTGKKSESTKQVNQLRIDATALMLEAKQKGLVH